MLEFLFDGACGLNTLTSRNVFSWRPPQNPFMETSSLAPSDILVLWARVSPVRGWVRGGHAKKYQEVGVVGRGGFYWFGLGGDGKTPGGGREREVQPRSWHHSRSVLAYLQASNHSVDIGRGIFMESEDMDFVIQVGAIINMPVGHSIPIQHYLNGWLVRILQNFIHT